MNDRQTEGVMVGILVVCLTFLIGLACLAAKSGMDSIEKLLGA